MIVLLDGSVDPNFAAMLTLAHRLFPPALLEPDEELRAEADGRSRLPYRYLVWSEDEVRGFVRFVKLAIGIGFVVHLGVDPERQGAGIGKRLLEAAVDALDGEVVVAEVESGKSLEWWRSQGAEVVSNRYTQPALHPDTAAVFLNLVALGTWRTVPRLIERFYAEVWERDAGDPLVRQAVGV